MQDQLINIADVEELQQTHNTKALEALFQKGRTTLRQGAVVKIARYNKVGQGYVFDTITNEDDLEELYQRSIKYLL